MQRYANSCQSESARSEMPGRNTRRRSKSWDRQQCLPGMRLCVFLGCMRTFTPVMRRVRKSRARRRGPMDGIQTSECAPDDRVL
jgi:hypothetical protein